MFTREQQLAILLTEITNDPETKGYANYLPDSPGKVIELINAYTEEKIKDKVVTARTILSACPSGASILDKLELAAQSISAVKWAMIFLLKDSGINIGDAATQSMINQLTQVGLLSESDKAELREISLEPASRAEVLGLHNVNEEMLLEALNA